MLQMRVVTYQSSRATARICRACKASLDVASVWPRDSVGDQISQVSHGLHAGWCEVHAVLPRLLAGEHWADLAGSVGSLAV